MSEPDSETTLSPELIPRTEPAGRFEAAWDSALRGGSPPIVEDYLGGIEEPALSIIKEELYRIERSYRVRMSFGIAQTIAQEARRVEPEMPSGETCLILPEPISDDPGATIGPGDFLGLTSGLSFDLSIPGPSLAEESIAPDPNQATIALSSSLDLVNPSHDNKSSQVPLHDMATLAVGPDGASPPSADRDEDDGKPRVKGYEIVGELGRGGMGVVYKAKQKGLNRLVAIKMVLGGEHAGEDDLARFKTEAEAVASIQHPNIVQIYEVGDKNGLPYFSLEYIDGGSLQQKIDGKPQSPREAAEIAEQLALAIQNCHDRGVIHRDLKPANVLMTLRGTPKITDFGLAKRIESDSKQTRTGSLMGTPSYMAPEQARGDTHAIGPLSDLYSLGAILYELLTGRPPFQGATLLDTMDQVRSQEPVPPTRLQPKIPRDLETICLKCLQKEPAKRYPDTASLAGDLRRFLDGEPIKARPVGRAEHAWRWARRNPKVAALSGSIIGLVLTLIGVATVSAIRSSREKQTIAEARRIAAERIDQATQTIIEGDFRRALDLIGKPDPLVERTPALADIRDDFRRLRAQVETFAEFRRLLERSRSEGFLGGKSDLPRAREHSREFVRLYDQIEKKTGAAKDGLPPLSPTQLQLFKEDVFDSFVVAADIEYESGAATKDPEKERQATLQAIRYLDRVEALLPPTKALYARRQSYKQRLGDSQGFEADLEKGKTIALTSPVDHFWQGYAERLSGQEAVDKKEFDKAKLHYNRAKAEFAKLLQVRPEHFWGYLEWGNCQYRLGEYYDAMIGYTACIQLRPDLPWPYHNRATSHAMLKEFDDAVADETIALARDRDYLDAFVGRARSHLALGHVPLALADFDRAIRLQPARADLLFERAKAHFQAKEYRKSLEDYDAVVGLLPKMAGPYKGRAKVRYELRDFEASIADWTTSASLLPKDVESRYWIGVLQMGLRRDDRALKALEACLAIDPEHALALLARAQIRNRQGDAAAALKDIDRVVQKLDASKLDASTKAYYLNDRVDLYRQLGRLEDSEGDARRSIALDPKQVDAYVSLALIEKRRGKPDAAEGWYDKMLSANPGSAGVHLRRAEFFRDLGRWDAALAEAGAAAGLDSDRGPVLAGLVEAGVRAARGEPDSAIERAEKWLKSAPTGDGRVYYAAACVWSLASGAFASAGDLAKASSAGERASALLSEALTLGFHDFNYQEKNRMAEDSALAPIRDRADVKRLVSRQP